MPGAVKSISVSELASEVQNAVKKVSGLKGAGTPELVTIPPWIIGFILREWEGKVPDLLAAATDAVREMDSAQGATPVALVVGAAEAAPAAMATRLPPGGHVILGYIRDPAATTLRG